jgi:hypothetical protein
MADGWRNSPPGNRLGRAGTSQIIKLKTYSYDLRSSLKAPGGPAIPDKMGSTGELKAFNRVFKEARKVDPSLRYFDYLHARKASTLEALAREATQ